MVTDNVKYQALNALVKVTKFQVDKNSFFIWILNVSIVEFRFERGIRPFKTEKRFVRMFNPTLFLLLLDIRKCICLEVKIWSKFRPHQSSDGVAALYNLWSWIEILYFIKASGIARLFNLWIFSNEIILSG